MLMTDPRLTEALTSLRAGFNGAFPARDKASDGWIGDAAHQAEVSGHNPDDTDGVRAEYADADTIPEVRAIDVDDDLRAVGVTMYDVIRRILATPADIARLRYIIYCPPHGPLGDDVPTIWTRNNGWQPRAYTGSSPHREHAHFSGDPNTDTDGRPWSVAQMGQDMADSDQLTTTNWRLWAVTQLLDVVDNHVNNTKEPVPLSTLLKRVDRNLATLAANLATLVGRDPVDEPAIVAGVLAGLTPEAIAEHLAVALPADLAAQVVAALGARLSAPQA
jgi:hypothetical protein